MRGAASTSCSSGPTRTLYPRAAATPPQDGTSWSAPSCPTAASSTSRCSTPRLRAALRTDPRLVFYDPPTHRRPRRLPRAARAIRRLSAVVDRLDWARRRPRRAHAFSEHQSRTARTSTAGTPSCCATWRRSTACSSRTTAGASTAGRSGRCTTCRRRAIWSDRAHTTTPARPLRRRGERPARRDAAGRPRAAGRVVGRDAGCAFRKRCWSTAPTPFASSVDPESERDAEWYYMWFLQPHGERRGVERVAVGQAESRLTAAAPRPLASRARARRRAGPAACLGADAGAALPRLCYRTAAQQSLGTDVEGQAMATGPW